MKKTLLFSLIAVLISLSVTAQDKKVQDQKAIKSMCGCYEVQFNFTETFSYSDDSTYQESKIKHEKVLEWVYLLEDNEDKIVMQHLLIVGNPMRPTIVKHWRQDWLYENTDLYEYHANNIWKYVQKQENEVQGQWTQKVFQVDDSPRYEGSSTWVHVDGRHYWENSTDAPLPRREHTTRDDYNVTYRRNRHEITSDGWIHDQDNDKIIREEGTEDVLLAQEKGFNTYVKVADSRCKVAQNWWEDNKAMWALARNNWDIVFARNTDLELEYKVNDTRLHETFYGLKPTASNAEVKQVIDSFVK